MEPVFKVRSTDELKPAEIGALTRLFEVVYGKPCPADLFLRKFGRSCLGYSIHSLMFLGEELIGAFSAIPVLYRFFGETRLFSITADLMIHPQYRGSIPRMKCLADGLYAALAREGVAFVFCCLRDEVFQLHRAVSGWRAIGKVHYYAAPLAFPLRAAVRVWNGSSATPPPTDFAIEKVNDDGFSCWRYGIFPTNYTTIALPGGGVAIYATELHYPIAGIPRWLRVGLLIDVFPLSSENFDAAIEAIPRREPALNVLAYQGYLPFEPRGMLQVPARYERQPWTLAGRILTRDQIDDRIFEIRQWNINLSNGDLV